MVDVVEFPTPDGHSEPGDEPAATIDITTEAFAKRLGNLLLDRRTNSKLSVRAMARRSDGHFSRKQLRQYESASLRVDAVNASALAALYRVDLDTILPLRTEITIDSGGGIISAGGVNATFEPGDPESVLETYLRLVRRLRNQERDEIVSLRREDIEGLAAHLDQSGESVVEQLGALMGATRTQRRLMAGMFMTGAMVITIAVPSVAAFTGGDSADDTGASGDAPSAMVQLDEPDVDPEADAGVPLDGPDPVDAGDDADADDDTSDDAPSEADDDAASGADDDAASGADDDPASETDDGSPVASGDQSSESGDPPANGAAPSGADSGTVDDVAVAAPPVPADTPPITEPSDGPVDPGSESGPTGPEEDAGVNADPEPAAEPDVAVGGPPIPSGMDGGEIVVPGESPVASDAPEPDPEPDPEPQPESDEPDPEPVEEPVGDDGEEAPGEEAPGEESPGEEPSEESTDGTTDGNAGSETDPSDTDAEEQADAEPTVDDTGGSDEEAVDKDKADKSDKDKSDKVDKDKSDKSDKETGLENADQNANENAGGLENANQNANENANPSAEETKDVPQRPTRPNR